MNINIGTIIFTFLHGEIIQIEMFDQDNIRRRFTTKAAINWDEIRTTAIDLALIPADKSLVVIKDRVGDFITYSCFINQNSENNLNEFVGLLVGVMP